MSYYNQEVVDIEERWLPIDTIPPVVPIIVRNALTLIGQLPKPSIFHQSPLYKVPLARGNMEYTVKRGGRLDNLFIWNYHDDIRVNGLPKYRVVDSSDEHNYRQALFIEMEDIDTSAPYLPKKLMILEEWLNTRSSMPDILIGYFNQKGDEGMGKSIGFYPRGVEGLRRVNEMLEAVISARGLR